MSLGGIIGGGFVPPTRIVEGASGSGSPASGLTLYNASDYGTLDTPANIRAAIVAAAAAANTDGGGLVYLPAGTYTVNRDGATSYCIDWPHDNVGLIGDHGRTILKMEAGAPNASVSLIRVDGKTDVLFRDVIFDGNWGNQISKIGESSHNTSLASGTIYVEDTTNAPASGSAIIRLEGEVHGFVQYTGKTATTLTGCTPVTGSTGTLFMGAPIVFYNTNAGLNHTTQLDPKNHGLFIRGSERVLIEHCTFRQCYGDAVWIGHGTDENSQFNWSRDVRVMHCHMDTLARNGVSLGGPCERVTIGHNTIANWWTCGIDSEPVGIDVACRDVFVHNNHVAAWPLFPGGGFMQAIGIVAGMPAGYNQSSAARGWRVVDNYFEGWAAVNNAIDVDLARNTFRTRHNWVQDTVASAVTAGTDTVTVTSHGLKTGDGPIYIITNTTLPGGITASSGNPLRSAELWAVVVDANNFKIATSFANALAGTVVDITDAGAGVISLSGPRPYSAIYVDHGCDDIRITHNTVVHMTEKTLYAGDGNNGAIAIVNYPAAALNNFQPAGVLVEGNTIHTYKGCHGIWINGVGGFAQAELSPVTAPSSGTATGVTRNTLTNTGAAWTTDQWIGWQVIMGGKVALVQSNTATVLSLYTPDMPAGAGIAWRTPDGEWTSTPAAGAYVITNTSGVLTVRGNFIDCGAYASLTAGGHGIYVLNDRAGSRIEVQDNKIKNATSWAVFVSGGTSKPALFLELRDNKAWDDQAAATTAAVVRFNDAQSLTSIGKLVMRGNVAIGGIATELSNVASGRWLISGGSPAQWAGYGSPETVVAAPVGSTYVRLDGGGGTTLYVKESTTGNTGWIPK